MVGYLRNSRRMKDPFTQVIEKISIDYLHNVILTDDIDGEIHLEYILFTSKGFVVLDIKNTVGVLYGGNQMDEWTVLTNHKRVTLRNPQHALTNRIAAMKILVRDVPVTGYVLFASGTDFGDNRPENICLPKELLEKYRKPKNSELDRVIEAFSPYWKIICKEVKSNSPD
tara:strand:+ start:5787 stop:6296 length:510 start_codon:yes stop_codon:yes gene_type:complete